MTLDEAIKRMQARIDGEFYDGDPEELTDMKLVIEALKRLAKYRADGEEMRFTLLPGETEE